MPKAIAKPIALQQHHLDHHKYSPIRLFALFALFALYHDTTADGIHCRHKVGVWLTSQA
ncbi:hypothetical protein QUF64_00050 [Anaerolineales bacterium HSG6]|nr:hypothetical protein [Anaerolineales bacterium HSG6]